MTTIRRVRLWRETMGYGWTYEVWDAPTASWREVETEGWWNRAYAAEAAAEAASRHDCRLVAPDSIIRPGPELDRERPRKRYHHPQRLRPR